MSTSDFAILLIQKQMAENVSFNIEYQHTAAADALGISIV